MSDAPPMIPDCKLDVTGAALIGCTAWLGRIVCGDNVEVLSGFPAECVDLVVTSPPYDDLRTYGGYKLNFQNIASELIRVLKPGGVIVWVVADETINGGETGSSFRQALWFMDNGMKLSDTMIYGKNASSPNVNQPRYMQSSEYMFVLVKGERVKTFNPLMAKNTTAGMAKTPYRKMQRNGEAKTYGANAAKERAEEGILSNIWIYNTGAASGDDAIAFDHPAPMPLKLAKDHIASWSNPGDVILDPFAGSGTTLKAAKELNRQWCGIEINPEYCKIAEARLSQDVLQLEIRQDAARQKQPDTAEYCAMGYRIDSPHTLRPNDPSSATRRTGRHDCQPRRHAGFAAAHG